MKKDLTNSKVERSNILNNNIAMPELYKAIGYKGLKFESKFRFTKNQLEYFYEVDSRTIERLLVAHENEISKSGYEVLTGERLKDFKKLIQIENVNIYNNINTAPSLGIFTFKALLNVGMLLTESERAKQVRSQILDIIIDVLNHKSGGHTKFINQREEAYIPAAIDEFIFHKKFTDAIDHFIEKNNFKYAQLINKVYKSIFREDANEYKKILKLKANESVRSTFYTEILRVISDYENAYAKELEREFKKNNRKLSLLEAHHLFNDFAIRAEDMMEASIEDARSKMASRDLVFRDALHEKLENYITEISLNDFNNFLGEQSMTLEKRLEQNKDVFKRLKNR